MLRLCTTGLLVILLTAGRLNGEDLVRNSIQRRTFNEGDSITVSVLTISHNVETCFVQSPNNGIFEYAPGELSHSTDKYTVEERTAHIVDCIVTINNLDKNDEGNWEISYTRVGGEEARAELYHFTINAREPESNEEDEGITLLPEINHYTNALGSIDITLNKQSFEEECYVRPPNGELTKTSDFMMQDVTVHSSSDFVSCRITVNPENEDLLGEWRLCGASTINGEEEMRCQPANIMYNNDNAVARWDTIVHPLFRHPVHFGGSINPAVVGTGDLITCHVVTPNGEDLVITPEIKYPHIERSAISSSNKCSVVISDIDSYMIGDWNIYGMFRSAVSGLNEVNLPLTLALYNENNPYEQAYNITSLNEKHVVNLGFNVAVDVSSTGKVDECSFMTPTGQIIYQNSNSVVEGVSFESLDDTVACKIDIGPITENMFGEWQLIGKFSDGNLFSEKQLTFQLIEEDPENPIVEEGREVQNLTTILFDSQMGENHIITIRTAAFSEPEGCHIRTATGLQYSFSAGLNLPDVEKIEEEGVECGILINVNELNMIGEWTLIARSTRLGIPIERRQPFVISVTETNEQLRNITVAEGSDLHLRLTSVTDLYDTCTLYGPNGEPFIDYEVDSSITRYCGYIVKGVSHAHTGLWTIQYGNNITYKETIDVTVIGSSAFTAENLQWTLGSSINISLGPEDAIYCRVEDSNGYIMYDGFGQCQLNVDRVEADHSGVWKLTIGVTGSVVMQESTFWVDVRGAHHAPVITTSVIRNAPVVSLTCSLPTGYGEVRACKFRDPLGNLFVAQHGVGQDGYSTNYESTATSNDCVLRLMAPAVADLGMWRCAMDTDVDTYFAFLTVTCPWLMQDPAVAAGVQTEPIIRPDRETVTTLEGHPTVLTCSVDSAIRYCYFRNRSGTIFNVGPAIRSSEYEYVGAGFHAGDCGIKFDQLAPTDDVVDWSCHIGLMDLTEPEQSVTIKVHVKEMMKVSHHFDAHNRLVVEATIHDNHPLDYCRFVRINGQGFTQHNAPEGFDIQVRNGHCIMHIADPNIMNLHPWTVVAKLTGVEAEIAKDTMETLLIEGPGDSIDWESSNSLSMIFVYVLLAVLILILVTLGIALIPKKNREWAMNRASSFRSSRVNNNNINNNNVVPVEPMEKQPLPPPPKYQEHV